MTIVASNVGNRKIGEHMRGILVGGYKVGKSWTLATAPDPVLLIDPDQRAASLAGKQGVFTLTPYDPPGLNQQPSIYTDILAIVASIEKSRRLGDIDPKFKDEPRANEEIKTIGLDSIQSTSRAILRYNMYTNPKELARTIHVPGQNLLFPNGWDTWNSDMECLEQLIARLIALAETTNLDFWITFHEVTENGKIDYFPGRHRQLVRYFNEVWRITRAQVKPQAQLVPTFNFTACTTLKTAPAVIDDPNIKQMIQKYGR